MVANEWGNNSGISQFEQKRSLLKRLKLLVYKVYNMLVNIYKVAAFINLIVFMSRASGLSGRGRCLSERLLGVRLVRDNPNMERSLVFSFINRIIVWGALSKSLTNLLPLLNEGSSSIFTSYIGPLINTATKLSMFQTLGDDDFGGNTEK